MQVGPYQVFGLMTDLFRLDGGAMFGVVPKNLWSKRISGDDENCIRLSARSLVLKTSDKLIFVDVGCGTKYEAKQRQIYNFQSQQQPPFSESALPITDIILTHLHFDHGGGISRYDESGKTVLSFPSANVYLNEKNFERAQNPGPREMATYFPQNVEPLKTGKLKLTTDGREIFPAISVHRVDGHTDGMQWVLVGKGEGAIAYPADLVPTAHHVPVPYVMGYDLCANTSMREKHEFLTQAEKEGWWLFFEHDADTSLAKVKKDVKGNFSIAETATVPPFSLGVQ